METLISTTDFNLLIESYVHESHNSERGCELMFNYANFLKKPLKLGYFVPCDENDIPLIEPKENNYNMQADVAFDLFTEDMLRYQEAKKKILFDLFETSHEDGIIFQIFGKCIIGFFSICNEWILSAEFTTIEDLVEFDLILTDTAEKEIGII